MSIEITRTKIALPPVRKDLCTRPRLLDLLYDLLDYRLILVIAQAGYGKTSLLVDFAHKAEMPVCWYSTEDLDRDPQRFFAYFIASIHKRFPAFGESSLATLETSYTSKNVIPQLVTSIVNDAYDHIHEHFLIIIDDFHLVSEQDEIMAFVSRFIQHASDNCHLVLSSRFLLPIPDLDLFVARSLVGGLGYEELAFQTDEIQSLILQNFHLTLSDEIAAELAQQTEGWITGLLLSAQTELSGMMNQLKAARLSGVDLYSYLARQVLLQQEPTIQDFMLKSSFLDEFNSEICRILWGEEKDWNGMITTLLARNLFIQPVGDTGYWFRYHHLFQEFLQNRCRHDCADMVIPLQEKIAKMYEDREEWERAYAIRKRMDDPIRLADLIECAGSVLIKNMRFQTLSNWLDALPTSLVDSRPKLISLKGTTSYFAGQVEESLQYLNKAEAALRGLNDRAALVRTLTRRATTLTTCGFYQKSIHDSQEALDIAAEDASLAPIYAEALRTIGMNHYHMGQLVEAIDNLSRSLKKYIDLNDQGNIANVNMEMGMCYRVYGDYTRALLHYNKALEHWRGVNDIAHQAQLLNNMGVLYHQRGSYTQAAKMFDEALVHARRFHYVRLEAYLLCSLGDIYFEIDAIDSASFVIDKAYEIARQSNDQFLILYTLLANASVASKKRDFDQANHYLDEAQNLVNSSHSEYEKGLFDLRKGQILLTQGINLKASEYFSSAKERFHRGGQKGEHITTSLLLSQAHFMLSDYIKSYELLNEAFIQALDLPDFHSLIVIGRETKPLLTSQNLPLELVPKVSSLVEQIKKFESEIPGLHRKLRPYSSSSYFITPNLSIFALGKLVVEVNGKPLLLYEWSGQRTVRELFFLLLSSDTGLSRDEIASTLWPESTPRQLKMRFSNTIYRLRYALGQDVISYENDQYSFNRNLDYEYDVDEFTRLIQLAKSSQHEAEKVSYYQKAYDQYSGSFYQEGEGIWVTVIRERLAKLFEEAGLFLAQKSLEAKDFQQALLFCSRLVEENHCLEEAHRIAMRSYAGLRDRGSLTKQYRVCLDYLETELGTGPSPQTIRLYKILTR